MRYKLPSFSPKIEVFVPLAIVGLLAPPLGGWGASAAFALEPEEADLVNDVSLEIPATFDIDEEDVAYVGITQCQSMVRNDGEISVTFETAFNPTVDEGVFREADFFSVDRGSTARIDCLTGELCIPVADEDIDQTATAITFDVSFIDLTGIMTEEECIGFDKEYFLRIVVDSAIGSETAANADGKIIVDTIRPSAPSGLVASATENRIEVEFEASADADVDRYFVFWSDSGFDGGAIPDDLELNRKSLGDTTSGDITAELDPTGSIFVAVAAQDETGNFSALSGAVEVSVIETNDFWEQYKSAGGDETGGCSTAASPGSLLSLVLVPFGLCWLGRRRRRLGAALLVGAALVALPLTASAETKSYGAFALKLGGYYPAIDDEFADTGPFETTFGTKNLIMGEIEVEGWLYQGIGKAGLGGSWGFSRVKGTAAAVDDAEAEAVEDVTSFGVMPLRAFGIYRFDWLAQHTPVPLAVGVEAGLDFYRWRIADGARDTATFDGQIGAGWTRGYHYGFEIQLLLDFLDPRTAAAFDLHWGVNDSYFFVEYLATRVDDFGGPGFDLSDNLWLFGLNFEF